jgi:diguanylate cyclase
VRREIPTSMRDLISDTPSAAREEFKQHLRLRRFLLASAFSVLYLLVLVLFCAQDKVDRKTLFEACAIVATVISVLLIVFRLGLNLRFPDPSLTVFQFLAAVFTMLFVVYRAPDSRLAFTAFFYVALMFSMLRCSGTKLAVLGLISLAAFMLVIWRRYSDNGDAEMLRLDMLLFAVIAVTFPWFVFS